MTNPNDRRFAFFFDRLEYCFQKGKGFSLFQADPESLAVFATQCERRGLHPFTIQLSSLHSALEQMPKALSMMILIQDLPHSELLAEATVIADKLVFPLWFRRIPICFFSSLDREAYDVPDWKGEDLHKDSVQVIRRLLAEQVLTILDRSNYQ